METDLQSSRIDPGSIDVDELLFSRGWSDGLPLVAPTIERVLAMLSGTSRNPDEILGKCAPNYGIVTVEKVAINAVMAGCQPKSFQLVLAATECLLDDTFNAHGVNATTMGATPFVVVNGDARIQAGISSGLGALGSGNRANSSVGRTLKLVLQNIGGASLGGTESTTIGSPSKFTLCTGEREERSPMWTPYHVQRGFNPSTSCVTVFAVTSGPHQIVDFKSTDQDVVIDTLARSLMTAYNHYTPLINDVVLIISPEIYDTLCRGGISSKEQLQQRLFDATSSLFAPHVSQIVQLQRPGIVGLIAGMSLGAFAMCKSFVGLGGLGFLPKFRDPDAIHVIVAGADAGKFSSFCTYSFLKLSLKLP